MKKVILSIAAIVAFGFANAQDKNMASEGFSKGDLFVTGALNYNTNDNKNTDVVTSNFGFLPQVGYFVNNNIAVGAKVGYVSSTEKTLGVLTADNSGFGLGAFGRYYFTPATKFSIFGQLGFDYASVTNNLSPNKTKTNSTNLTLGAGLNYFVSSHFSLEAGLAALSYGSSSTDIPGDKGSSAFSLGGNWTALTVGVNYKF